MTTKYTRSGTARRLAKLMTRSSTARHSAASYERGDNDGTQADLHHQARARIHPGAMGCAVAASRQLCPQPAAVGADPSLRAVPGDGTDVRGGGAVRRVVARVRRGRDG